MKNKKFYVFTILLLFLILMFTFLLPLRKISGNSMNPNLKDGNIVLMINKKLRFKSIDYGDIVSFKAADEKRGFYIKRVVGKPNDEIAILDGKVFRNGKRITEAYVADGAVTFRGDKYKWMLGEDEYFVLGDNRNFGESYDSRAFGPVKYGDIKCILIYKF